MLTAQYNPKETEARLIEIWDKQGIYSWNPAEPRENNFTIDTPPPTVSGLLHMGHVFSYTQTDFIARYQRMKGKNVFYPIGFDDNGLPTERLVEKEKKVKASQMQRSEFIKLCQEVVATAEIDYKKVWQTVALSVDWRQEYQTINALSRKISQMSFLDLYQKGLLERKFAPAFWDPVDLTAIAQAEIEDKEMQGHMHYINFTDNSGQPLQIATTRPEMIPACVALLCHPDDKRFNHLIGSSAITPIFHSNVPIIADSAVEMEKGTGLVMCCTFGDIQDIAWWRQHNLPTKNILNKYGKMENTDRYDGLKAADARKKIVEDLGAAVVRMEPVTQFVKCAERSGAPLEIISTNQWYIKVLDYKEQLLAKSAQCNWFPAYMKVRLDNWINGLNQDWCISRQRFFGVPFPAWYSLRNGEEGKILLPDVSQLPVDPLVDLPAGYSRDEIQPDMDVMDTWATSAVSPQLNSHAINQDYSIDYQRHQKIFPFDLRPQAHEIIRTWAFYTITKAMQHEDTLPWHNVMVSGWCLASDKTKMSKSKGNVITPQLLLEEKSADVVRYWASTSKLGVDTAYSDELMKIGKKLVNKLWNAAKFCTIHLEHIDGKPTTPIEDQQKGIISEDLDLWLLSRLKQTIESATVEFERFEYCSARAAVEDFFWNDFCDNYLEFIKTRVYSQEATSQKERQSAIYTLHHCLYNLLRLFAPTLPFVTEEINGAIFGGDSVHLRGSWPKQAAQIFDAQSIEQGELTVVIMELIRKAKSISNISLRAELSSFSYCGPKLNESVQNDLLAAANAKHLKQVDNLKGDAILTSDCGKVKVYVEFATTPEVANS
jgi:valyl-tRNA synthetase